MTYVDWPKTVNTKFFNDKPTPQENERELKFASGRTIKILQNTRFIFDISCCISVKRPSEYIAFWSWYTDILGGTVGIFRCPVLKRLPNSTEYFRFKSIPKEEKKQLLQNIDLEIEEVY